MQRIRIQTAQNVTIDYKLATVWQRILARLIDDLITYVYLIGVILLGVQFEVINYVYVIAFALLPTSLYHPCCEIFFEGQSFGKRQMGIKVISASGRQPSVGAYLLRWAAGLLDFAFSFYGLALICVAVSRKSQRLGDIVAGTIVVDLRHQHAPSVSDLFEVEETYQVVFPQAANLTDKDIRMIEQFIEAYYTNQNTQALLLMDDKVRQTLGVESNLRPLQFLKTVIKDYKHLTSGVQRGDG